MNIYFYSLRKPLLYKTQDPTCRLPHTDVFVSSDRQQSLYVHYDFFSLFTICINSILFKVDYSLSVGSAIPIFENASKEVHTVN